jgi:aminopeptidase N
MEEASGMDLNQFERTWYNQAGTPTLDVTDAYDAQTQEYRLSIHQFTPPTLGQPIKEPLHIPVRVGLINANGKDMPLRLEATQSEWLTNGDILNLKQAETTFVFKNVKEKPIPSLLRNWSAPVKLNYEYSRDQLSFLMSYDSDGFNRWEAGQLLDISVLKELVAAHKSGKPATVDARLIAAFQTILVDRTINSALAAMTLQLPTASYLAELYLDGEVDVDAIHAAIKQTEQAIGQWLESLLLQRFNESRSTENRPYEWNKKDVAERAIKNTTLSYLVEGNPAQYLSLAVAQFDHNQNMTDVRSALRLILDYAEPATCQAKLEAFYQEHQKNPLAMNQWFTDQALADHPEVLAQVRVLLNHPSYNSKNPNAVRALVGGFAANSVHFHSKDGSGYQFLADQVISTEKFNPSLAAGLSKNLSTPHRFDQQRQALIKTQLERIQANAKSKQVQEIVGKTLTMLANWQGTVAVRHE